VKTKRAKTKRAKKPAPKPEKEGDRRQASTYISKELHTTYKLASVRGGCHMFELFEKALEAYLPQLP